MSELIFGIMFTIPALGIGTILVLCSPLNETWPFAAFTGVAAFVGILIMCKGIKSIIHERTLNKKGFDTYGIIVDINQEKYTRMSYGQVKRYVYFYGDIRVVGEDGKVYRYIKSLGSDRTKCNIGDFLKVKYLNNDIQILNSVPEYAVPTRISTTLNSEL